MHDEVLNAKTKAVWEKCGFLKDMGFYLSGGTALALQLGHRISVDLDFFSDQPIKKTLLSDIEREFQTNVSVIFKTTDELTFDVLGVKITCLHYPFPPLWDKVESGIVPLVGIRDIASMKAYTLGRRQAVKDYVDLYCVFSRNLVSLPDAISDAEKRYGDAFNGRLFLEQLVYTDDLDDGVLDWLWKPVSTKGMKQFFTDLIIKERDSLTK